MIDESPLLELEIQLEFGDYLRFQYYDSLRRLWWTIPIFLLAALVSLALVGVSAYYQDSYLLRDITPFCSLVFLGGIFVFASPYLSSKREFEVNAALRRPIRYRVLETGMESISPRRKGKLPWDKVKEARETGTAFFLYTTVSRAFILPKRKFPSGVETAAFRELMLVIVGPARCRFKLDRVSRHF